MRKTVARSVAAALVLTLSATALAGCSTDQGAQKSDKLVYWSMWKDGEDQQKVIKAALDEFTADTGITVEVQWTGRDVGAQIIPRLTSGNPPDLFDGGTDLLASMGQGALHDLSGVYETKIDGEELTVGQAIPPSLRTVVAGDDGKPFLVPYEIIGSTIWYNAKVTPSLAAKAPATWDELLTVLNGLKAQGRTPVALDGDIADYEAYWLVWALLRAGGAGTLASAAGDKSGAAFDSEPWKVATEAIGTLIDGKYFPPGFNGTKFPTQQSAWADRTSRTDIILMGSWLPSEATQSLTKQKKNAAELVEFRSFPFPAIGAGDKGAGVVDAGPIGFTIPTKALHKDAAERFIAYFLNKDRLSKISSVAKNLTPRTDIEPPAELADYAKEFAGAKTYVLANDGLYNREPKWVVDVWQPAVVQFFAGKLRADEFRAVLKEKTIAYHKNK